MKHLVFRNVPAISHGPCGTPPNAHSNRFSEWQPRYAALGTPFIVRSGSGNFQAWYRHSGEKRRVRPDPSRPIDILGDGFVVAPPSEAPKGHYTLVQGSLDDLDRLPPMRRPAVPEPVLGPVANAQGVVEGKRNDTLWRLCMKHAPDCAGLSDLMEFAMQANRNQFYEPLATVEVVKVVASAWQKECDGENFFGGRKGIVLPVDQLDALLAAPDAFVLFAHLKRHHWGREFVCANAMAASIPGTWYRQKVAAARLELEKLGLIEMLRPAIKGVGPALYRFRVSRIGHQ